MVDHIKEYLNPDFILTDFPAGARVLDVGCGEGCQLREMQLRGCVVTGIDPDPKGINSLREAHFDVEVGVAEKLPYADSAFDGIVCSVVLPYCEEHKAIAEWRRVLKDGGEVRASYHGSGCALRWLHSKTGVRSRFYGLRMLLNTFVYQHCGLRLPLFLGDTLHQTESRLDEIYRRNGFILLNRLYSTRTFKGRPVFIYDHLKLNKNSRV